MSYMRLFSGLVLCSVFAIGCVVEEGAVDVGDTTESVIMEDGLDTSASWSTAPEASRATEDSMESEASVEACFRVWDCQTCSNGSSQNVLVEICDDGSERIVRAGPCGQPCF